MKPEALKNYHPRSDGFTGVAKEILFIALLALFGMTNAIAGTAKAVQNCCGDDNYVYRPSKDRIKISNGPEVVKQISKARHTPEESAKLHKAIKNGNYVMQAYVNKDLFNFGSDQEPPEILEGWSKYYSGYISMSSKQLLEYLKTRSPNCCYAGVSKDPRHGKMVCPMAILSGVEIRPQKILMSYQFIHIARHAAMGTGVGVIDHPLELAENGKVGTFRIALNNEFKYVPNDPETPDWWSVNTTKDFKNHLRRRLGGNFYEDLKPQFRVLLKQIIEAEKICSNKNLFN